MEQRSFIEEMTAAADMAIANTGRATLDELIEGWMLPYTEDMMPADEFAQIERIRGSISEAIDKRFSKDELISYLLQGIPIVVFK